MVGFIITGHCQFAPGLASALTMVAGEQSEFETLPFDEGAAATYGETLQDCVVSMAGRNDGVIVFVDLLGGTPFNQAMLATQQADNVRVIAGTNLPMLIETLFTRNAQMSVSVDELVALALNVGVSGIVTKQLADAPASKVPDEFDGEGL